MIRGDTKRPIQPYFPGCRHPALEEVDRLVATEGEHSLGGIEQVVFERRQSERSKKAVVAALARDVDLIRRIVGPITKINALAAAEGELAYANLAVQMSGAGPTVVRWSVGPAGDEPGGQISLIGPRGQARLQTPTDERRWRWEFANEPEQADRYSQWDGPRASIEAFARQIRESQSREPHSENSDSENTDSSFDWSHACRATELAEAAERSVARGRTIELHLEPHNEEETFKGMMAAGGCLLVFAALLGLFVASLIGGLQLPSATERLAATAANEPSSISPWLRIWPVYPFLIFLGLQLLRLVFRSKPNS
jgi:hypothetical protein